MTIPKKIFTISDKKLNTSVENHLRVFFEGWDFQSFTTDEIHEILMNDNYPNYSFLPYLFDNADENTKKNIFIVHTLYKYGGIYIEPNVFLLQKISKSMLQFDAIFVKSNFFDDHTHIFQGFFATKPKNIIFLSLFDEFYNKFLSIQNFENCILQKILEHDLSNTLLLEQTSESQSNCNTIMYKKQPFLTHFFVDEFLPFLVEYPELEDSPISLDLYEKVKIKAFLDQINKKNPLLEDSREFCLENSEKVLKVVADTLI